MGVIYFKCSDSDGDCVLIGKRSNCRITEFSARKDSESFLSPFTHPPSPAAAATHEDTQAKEKHVFQSQTANDSPQKSQSRNPVFLPGFLLSNRSSDVGLLMFCRNIM